MLSRTSTPDASPAQPKPPNFDPTPLDFEPHKDLILELLKHNECSEVIEIVYNYTGFRASQEAYDKQVKQWQGTTINQGGKKQHSRNARSSSVNRQIKSVRPEKDGIKETYYEMVSSRPNSAPSMKNKSSTSLPHHPKETSRPARDRKSTDEWSNIDPLTPGAHSLDDLASFDFSEQPQAQENITEDKELRPRSQQTCHPLHEAARQGNLYMLKLLLKTEDNCDKINEDGVTPLWLAAQQGHYAVALELLDRGANPHFTSQDEETLPLHEAAHKGHSQIVHLLAGCAQDIDARAWNGMTPLWLAAQSGDSRSIKILLQKGANANLPDIRTARTPLHMAARSGRSEAVHILLQNTKNINARACDGATPIFLAIQRGDPRSVSLLLDSGADVDITALDDFRSPLHAAAAEGHLDILEMLLKRTDVVNLTTSEGMTPLYVAAKCGHHACVALLLRHHAAIDIVANDGYSALHTAAQLQHYEVIRLLLEHTVAIDTPAKDGTTPLILAAEAGDIKSVKMLLEKGASVSTADRALKLRPLHLAAENGHFEVLELLLKHCDAEEVNTRASDGVTPLWFACYKGDVRSVRALLNKGATVNARDNERGNTVLHQAVASGEKEIVKMILDRVDDADIDAKSFRGHTPLWIAASRGHLECAWALLQRGARTDPVDTEEGWYPIHLVAHSGHTSFVELLLDHPCRIDATTKDDLTPLFLAAEMGHIAIVHLLLEMGVNPDTQSTGNRRSALHQAVERGHTDIVRLLITKGEANINVESSKGETPLLLASMQGDIETVRMLLEHGASVNHITSDCGSSPMHEAAFNGHFDTIQLLVDYRAQPDVPDYLGTTPLWFAAAQGHRDVVQLLMRFGADPNKANSSGRLPLHQAALHGHGDIVSLLLKHTDNVDVRGPYGETPLCLAAHHGDARTVRLLLVRGANPNIMLKTSGRNALHQAAHLGHSQVVRMLLDLAYIGDINATTYEGQTALILASKSGNLETVRLLLEHHADTEPAEYSSGSQALHFAAHHKNPLILKTLLKHVKDVDVPTKLGLTPIWFAAQSGDTVAVHYLLQRGANLKVADPYTGRNVLHQATQKGFAQITKLLCEKNIELDVLDHSGVSALGLAVAGGWSETARVLHEAMVKVRETEIAKNKGKQPSEEISC